MPEIHHPNPSFPRAYPSFPRTREPSQNKAHGAKGTRQPAEKNLTLRGAKGTRAQHAGDARKPPTPPFEAPNTKTTHPSSPHPLRHSREPLRHSRKPTSVIPASHPSFPRTREPRKNKAHRQTSPSRSEGDACAARRGCPKTTNNPSIIPPPPPSFPRAIRPREPSVIRSSEHQDNPSIIPPPPPSFSEHQDNPSIIPPPPPSFPQALRHSRGLTIRHSRGRGNPEKNKARHFHPNPHPSRSDRGTRRAARPLLGDARKPPTHPHHRSPPQHNPPSFPSFQIFRIIVQTLIPLIVREFH